MVAPSVQQGTSPQEPGVKEVRLNGPRPDSGLGFVREMGENEVVLLLRILKTW